MSIEELENKHGDILLEPLNLDEFRYKKHTKLSVEYAISVLEEVLSNNTYTFGNQDIYDSIEVKIQELKQYFNDLH